MLWLLIDLNHKSMNFPETNIFCFLILQRMERNMHRDMKSGLLRSTPQQQFYVMENFEELETGACRADSMLEQWFDFLSKPKYETSDEYIVVSRPMTLNKKTNLRLGRIITTAVEKAVE